MIRFSIVVTVLCGLLLPMSVFAKTDSVSTGPRVLFSGNKGLVVMSNDGKYVFRPVILFQGAYNLNYYDDAMVDDEGRKDHVYNSGFSVPYAVVGVAGKMFGIATYNFSVNASASGGAILQQAWVDVVPKASIGVRFGKIKTPISHHFITKLGENLFPVATSSMITSVALPNGVGGAGPRFIMGFDLGVAVHGVLRDRWGYEVGVYNGAGPGMNVAGKTISNDWHVPSLLYAGRLSFSPMGEMPRSQGSPELIGINKMQVAVGASANVESENRCTNDIRMTGEFAWLCDRLYLGAEGYLMHVDFTKATGIDRSYNYWGAYVQAGYFLTTRLQGALRYDVFDRNSTSVGGLHHLPGVGVNYFIPELNIKLQAMYQYRGMSGYATEGSKVADRKGCATHNAMVQLQFTF